MGLDDHPTVKQLRGRAVPAALTISAKSGELDAEMLRKLCLEAGADDVGFVRADDPRFEIDHERMKQAFPGVRSLICILVRMQQENVRSPARSVANQAFHASGYETDEIARRIVLRLQDMGVRACNPSMAFPMEIARIPEDRPWIISHKLVAEAAGLGRMGIHRSVIHPRFGSFVLFGTIMIDREISRYGAPLDYNPCVECKLCVAACPVGALGADGHFDASSCMTHNYREFMGGFTDWIETVVSSGSVKQYQRRIEDGETLSVWQSLAYGPNYKAAYCIAVCPAGEDVLGPFIEKRAEHIERIVRPLQQKNEPLYVRRGSDAEAYAAKRFPHKRLRRVQSGVRPTSVQSFLRALPWLFQRGRSEGLAATYHFSFTGRETTQATIDIREQRIDVRPGLIGAPDVRIGADSTAWVKFLRGETPLPLLIVTRKLRLSPVARGAKLLAAFGKCFPP